MKHFISSLSVLCANTPPCEGRVSSRKILSLLLILFLSIGNVWGAEETESYTCAKGTIVDNSMTWNLTSCTIEHEKAESSNELAVYAPWRIYAKQTITITPKSGITITKMVITSTSDDYATAGTKTWTNATATSSSTNITVIPTDGTSKLVYTNTNSGQTRWQSVVITYTSGGTEPPTPAKTYDVTWMVNGEEWATSEDVEENTQITTLPTEPTDECAGKVFQGWTDREITDGQKPAILFKDESPKITEELTTFYAVFATVPAGGGTGGSITISSETENFPTAYGTANAFTEYTLEGYKFQIQQVYINGGKLQWRASGNKNGTGTMYNSSTFPANISSVVIVFDASDTNKNHTLKVGSSANPTGGTTITPSNSGATYTFDCSGGSYDYFVLTNGSGAGYITSITINYGSVATPSDYTTSCSGSTEPVASLTATPTTIDFGTVYEGATVADQTVAVNFANLNGDVTYSVLSTPFSATGNISTTGDNITISADASTIGEYSQTLIVASTTDSKTAEVTVKMNVVEKPAPTGTFTLYTGDLIEGDYVVVYDGIAMTNTVSSNRLANTDVTITDNKIVDPLAATIWHIAKSGEYWTIYNEAVNSYAASNGTKNQAQMLADGTDDKALWTATKNGDAFNFENKHNASNSVNAKLQRNGTYGWACYAAYSDIRLYRKAGTQYNVNVSATENGTVTANPTSAEKGTTITLTIEPADGYLFDALTVTDASSNTIEVADNKFTMPASDVTVTATFKENEKPAATLTLSKNGVAEAFPGSWKQDDVVTLPSITSDCVKEFVGWSADKNCTTEPEYKAGEEYTLAGTAQTLYAVYATVQGGGEVTSEDLFENNSTYNATNPATIDWTLSNVVSILQEQGTSTSAVNSSYDKDPRWYKSHVITITPSVNITKIVTKAQSNDYATELANSTYTNATATVNNDIVTITPTDGNEKITIKMGAQARLYTLTVTYASAATYSYYSTTCAAALANPTFSLAEGKYTEAKSVEIEYTEGTIYYTTDGTTPTASSTQYTGTIALNDCGEYTIKAIAISSDSQSDVVSATYTIKLPLTNSQAAPYTEAEAIAVYDGDCYDNQDVYVKGTVKTATFYNSGTYTITLTNGFQFYKFYKDGSKTLFVDGEINKGDVLVACGKLSKYNTTYQLAEGCYLVEHEPYTEPKTDISNTEATAYTVDKAFELIADVKSDLTKEVYVKGLVAVAPTSNPTAEGQMTYKISDNGENTGNVLTVYLGLNLNGEKFTSKNDVQQGDYVVVKGKLLDYNSTYELNKGNQLVQHIKAATITISDITMEVGETKTIAATITPDAAKTEVTYSIKAGSDDCITLSENNITAKAEGTATIVATIATAEGEYMGKTIDFTVTVGPKSEKTNVVILAELGGKWYAMKGAVPSGKSGQLDAIEVTYFNGTLYNVPEEDKSSITWTRSVVDGKATFVNNGKYLKGGSSTDLTLVATVDDACKWMWNEENGYYTTNTSGTIRTFLYRENYNFKNYGANQAGKEDANGDYSALPVVTAPVYATGDIVYTRDVTPGNYGTICLPYASDNFTGATFFEVAGKKGDKVFFDEVTTLEAGKPYIFMAESNKIVLSQTGESADEAGKSNSLQGTFSQINPATDNELVDNYMVVNNVIKKCGANCGLEAYRAYFIAAELETLGTPSAPVPGRRRVAIGQAPQVATGVDQVQGDNVPAKMIINGQLYILRGEKMYDAQGKLVK